MHHIDKLSLVAVAAIVWPAAVFGQQALVIYTDSLASGWADWSWNTTRNFANSSPVHGSSGKSIAVTYTAAWGGLYLHTDTHFNRDDYTALSFWVHGGTTGGQLIQVVPYDAAGAAGAGVSVAALSANTWTNVQIPMSSFNVTVLSGLVWQDRKGSAQPVFYLDDMQLTPGTPQPPGQGPALTVDAAAARHIIDPLVYGMCFVDSAMASELHVPVNRWGGNATTRYNWQLSAGNHASDWFFENLSDSNADTFVTQNRNTQTDTLMTVPLIGWTPKNNSSCGFSVAKYGPQQQTDQWRPDCGNGKHTDGTNITGNDPTDTSIAIGPDFVQGWITHLVSQFGAAGEGGVLFYDLDNEPMLWNSTHRDVHPNPTSYDEMGTRTTQYAAAIKATDPGAFTLGPVLWGWCAYFYSALDGCGAGSDRAAHGNLDFVPWYLQQMHNYEQQHGVRILDYLDLHNYPQGSGVALGGAGDATTKALRLRETRSLWDPTYVDESWINQVIRLIPRMHDWVNTYYPGTKLAITEYNWGAFDDINGALAQADILGIFGREGLDLATIWTAPSSTQPVAFAFRVYRNYDAAGGEFGGTSVQAVSADQGKVSVYAAQRADNRLTLVLINKTLGILTSSLTISNYPAGAAAQAYRYSAADLAHIVHQADLPVSGGVVSVEMPASSITLLVIAPLLAPADFDHNTWVDGADFEHLQACATGPALGPPAGNCTDADLDNDGDVDQDDFGIFQRCLSGTGNLADPNCAG